MAATTRKERKAEEAAGHWVRPNSAEAEALAITLDSQAASALHAVNLKSGLPDAASIPAEVIVKTIAAQMLAPTKHAGSVLAATRQLAAMAGISGTGGTLQEIEDELRAMLAESRGRPKPGGPRPLDTPARTAESTG